MTMTIGLKSISGAQNFGSTLSSKAAAEYPRNAKSCKKNAEQINQFLLALPLRVVNKMRKSRNMKIPIPMKITIMQISKRIETFVFGWGLSQLFCSIHYSSQKFFETFHIIALQLFPRYLCFRLTEGFLCRRRRDPTWWNFFHDFQIGDGSNLKCDGTLSTKELL
jgi:hypothetical protein